MGIESMDYTAILNDLEAKKAALEATILAFRGALALGALGQSGETSANGPGPSTYISSIGGGGDVPAGAFLGKSIPEAARLYLSIVKRKQTSKEIADGLKKGGVESTSKNFQQILHTGLDRARKNPSSGIVKLDRSYWGLREWYPAGIGIGTPSEKRGRKKIAKKNKVARLSSSVSAQHAPPTPVKANERALEFLRNKSDSEHSLAEIAEHIGMGIKGARLILGKLRKAGKIRMSAPGTYVIGRPLLVTAGD